MRYSPTVVWRFAVGEKTRSQGLPLPLARYALPRWGNLQFPGRCPAWHGLPRWGKWNNSISIPRSCPNGHRVPTCRCGSVGANSATTFSIPCPNGASHTSPGCQPWESTRKKQTRVLKERRIAAGLGSRPRLFLCGVPSEHTYSLGCGSQGWHPGLVCVAPFRAICSSQGDALPGMRYPVGANGTMAFRSRVHAPTGIAFQRVGAAPLERIPPRRFRSHAPSGQFAVPKAMPCLACVAPLGQLAKLQRVSYSPKPAASPTMSPSHS